MAYFLTDKVNADILSQLRLESIKMLHETGSLVHAVIFDGVAKNIVMAKKLGSNSRLLEGLFPNPSQTTNKIHVIFDIFHMIKLARNVFNDMKNFFKRNEEKIS